MNGMKLSIIRKSLAACSFFLLLLTALWAEAKEQADLVIVNAKIITMNKIQPSASAFAVRGNKIFKVGSDDAIRRMIGDRTKIINAQKGVVLPGFIDSHIHPAVAVLFSTLGVNLTECKNASETINKIKKYVNDHPELDKITGFGFASDFFPSNGPDKEILNKIEFKRPVFIAENSGHGAWVNSKALEILKIDKDTPDPLPGAHFYVRNADGSPTGYLVEGAAFWPHLKTLNIGTVKEFKKGLKKFLPQLAEYGITSVYDAGMPAVEENSYKGLLEMEKAGDLPVRYFGSHYLISRKDALNAEPEMQKLKKLYTSELVRPLSIKISNDGFTAKGHFIQFDESELLKILGPVFAANLDIHIHSVMEDCTNAVLNAIERLQAEYPGSRTRATLTHLNRVYKSDMPRFAALKVIANLQPASNLLSDFPAGSGSLLTDSPLYIIKDAVIGRGPSVANETITVLEALTCLTVNNAKQLKTEKYLGKIKEGYLADIVILSGNPLTVKPEKITDIKVMKTIMNGKLVYEL
ncbi:MAG: amidohydrolase family protein [Lentisphaerae bacterium]|nr:amidohydrolase family protein [Lentisphaerota bacterium]MCP4101397.1 amidohydrolase family protein [Lentisphaerota bacterium]